MVLSIKEKMPANSYPGPVAVLGTTGPGTKIICGALVWKFFVNHEYSSSSFSLKLLCLKGVFKCYPVISFQFFLRCGAPSGLPKVWGLAPWPPNIFNVMSKFTLIFPFVEMFTKGGEECKNTLIIKQTYGRYGWVYNTCPLKIPMI